jgi:hypothetical protein
MLVPLWNISLNLEMGIGLDILISPKQLLNENKLSKCKTNIKFSLEVSNLLLVLSKG